ncbi:HWE histidine kinase domain-containing protein [Sphingomonas sp. 4RDLI-65]|uniref:HWE histidine kinase domain-containing protein n=1 Tax=Sphingomonas sp. 4RDLI-65 TaxID=3111641 RepID=UPI003C2645D5
MRDIFASSDLDQCAREQIAFLDHVQSFGFLIALANDWTITRASANLQVFLGTEAAQAIGMKVDRLVAQTALHDVRNRLAGLSGNNGTERLYGVRLTTDRRLFDLAMHYSGDVLILEGEPCSSDQPAEAATLVRSMMARLQVHSAMPAFLRDAARQVRAITGFDRAMIYRFHDDGVGEVVAEAARSPADSLLGLHYPASDIPVQARALYLRNPFRIIADVHAETVAILPRTKSLRPLDLSLAVTRAVSPVHIEYLRNMAVGASLSISIIVEGRLWGLIACHHQTARTPSFVMRSAAELFGAMFSLKLESRLRSAAVVDDDDARSLADRIILTVASNPALLSDPAWLMDSIGDMIDCDGVAVYLRGELNAGGITPDRPRLLEIAHYLDTMPASRVFDTDGIAASLSDDGRVGGSNGGDDEAELAPGLAAGLLAIPISRTPRDYVMLFRRERIEAVQWGGNPDKPTVTDDTGRISPRKSFEAFRKTVRNRSVPFTERDRRVGETIRAALIEVILRLSEETVGDRDRATKQQDVLIGELNHRVRNILALIRGLITQTNAPGITTAAYVEALSGRVQALARAHDQVTLQNWSPAPLATLFEAEVAAFMPDRHDRFRIEGPTVLLRPEAYSSMALVVHELVTNSMKYGALSDGGSVEVMLDYQAGKGLYLTWREVGGPRVQPPTRVGFGTVIVERTVPFDLQGTAAVRYPPEGFEADFFIPARHLASRSDEATTRLRDPHAPSSRTKSDKGALPLKGMRILLLEDNMIVALTAENLLEDLGATSVWTAAHIAGAEDILGRETIDLAMLDINLGEETSVGLAMRLRSASIPFFFASGYGDDSGLNAELAGSVIVRKPYGLQDLHDAVVTVLRA